MPSVASIFSRELLKSEGAGAINEAIGQFVGQCLEKGTGPAIAGCLTASGSAALPIVGAVALLLGPLILEARGDAKAKKRLNTALAELQGAINKVATDAGCAREQIEAIFERRRFVWARISGADQADLARRLSDQVREDLHEVLEAHRDDDPIIVTQLENVRVIASDSNFRIRNVEKMVEESKAALEIIVQDYVRRLRAEELRNERLGDRLSQMEQDQGELADRLRSALAQQAESKLATGESLEDVLEELRAGNPLDLLEFLTEQIDEDEAALEAEETRARAARERVIARHRERATIAFPLGEIDQAEASLHRILSLLPDDPDARNRLGHLHDLRGDLDEAAEAYRRVLDSAPDESWRAVALGNLGLIEQTRGNLDEAEWNHKRSLEINEALGRKEGTANQLGNLGLIEQKRGNLDEAERYHKRSLEIEEALGRKEGMASDLGNLGLIERIRGNLNEAERYHKRSLEIEEALGRKEGMASELGNLGLIEQARGNLDEAERYHKRSLEIEEALGRKEGMASELGNLGLIERNRGNLNDACRLWRASLALFEQVGMQPQVDLVAGLLRDNTCPDKA